MFWFQCAGSADFVYVSVCLSNVNRHLFFKNDSKFEKNGNQNTLAHTFYVPLYWISYLQSDNSYSYACIRPKVTLANRMKNAKIGIVTGCVNMRRNYSADRFWKIKSTSSMQVQFKPQIKWKDHSNLEDVLVKIFCPNKSDNIFMKYCQQTTIFH